VCPAECIIVTEPPNCTCANPLVIPICHVECRENQFADQCPDCQTVCIPNELCSNPLCQQTVANWACRKPSSCPHPTCELNCESPPLECTYNGTLDPWKKKELNWAILLAVAIVVIIIFLRMINTK